MFYLNFVAYRKCGKGCEILPSLDINVEGSGWDKLNCAMFQINVYRTCLVDNGGSLMLNVSLVNSSSSTFKIRAVKY
jgi:hypothetical protein